LTTPRRPCAPSTTSSPTPACAPWFKVAGPGGEDRFFAIDNVDPKNGASVLSRGLVGNLGEHVVVASPLYKHHIVLATGECLESPEWSVKAYPVALRDGQVWVTVA